MTHGRTPTGLHLPQANATKRTVSCSGPNNMTQTCRKARRHTQESPAYIQCIPVVASRLGLRKTQRCCRVSDCISKPSIVHRHCSSSTSNEARSMPTDRDLQGSTGSRLHDAISSDWRGCKPLGASRAGSRRLTTHALTRRHRQSAHPPRFPGWYGEEGSTESLGNITYCRPLRPARPLGRYSSHLLFRILCF